MSAERVLVLPILVIGLLTKSCLPWPWQKLIDEDMLVIRAGRNEVAVIGKPAAQLYEKMQ